MRRTSQIEWWKDEHCVCIGHYDGAELEAFSVIVYINDLDYDITDGLGAKSLDAFKEQFLEHVRENHSEQVDAMALAKREREQELESA